MADPPVRLPQDLPRGRKALDKGCKLGNLDACRVLISYDSDVTPPGTACAGWEALCKRGDPRSCSFFGACLNYGEHFRRDPAQARRLFEEGCAHGERVACRELAFVFLEGSGVPVDISKGFELIDRACRMDDPAACAREGRQFERGQGVPRDLERAKALYRGACARGIMPTPCEGLRRLGEVPPPTAVSSPDAGNRSSPAPGSTGNGEFRRTGSSCRRTPSACRTRRPEPRSLPARRATPRPGTASPSWPAARVRNTSRPPPVSTRRHWTTPSTARPAGWPVTASPGPRCGEKRSGATMRWNPGARLAPGRPFPDDVSGLQVQETVRGALSQRSSHRRNFRAATLSARWHSGNRSAGLTPTDASFTCARKGLGSRSMRPMTHGWASAPAKWRTT